jgi:DNA-binding transcriptional LysR family regulator
MERTPNWDSYRSLLAVLEEGSLSGAARALGLTQPTIGRHIQAIEQTLKRPLFVRSQRGLSPTEAALALKPYAETLKMNAEALARAASREASAVRGAVRITASEVIAAEVLPFVLRDLAEREPGLSFEVEASNRNLDLMSRAADVAIRMAPPQQQSLIAVKAGEVDIGIYATEGYIARRGRLERMEDAGRHVLIGFDRMTPFVRAVLQSYDLPPREAFTLRTDGDLTALGALRAGLGIGFCQTGIARREGWVRLLPQLSLPLPCWVTMHEDLKASPPCRRTFDALVAGMRAYIAGQANSARAISAGGRRPGNPSRVRDRKRLRLPADKKKRLPK